MIKKYDIVTAMDLCIDFLVRLGNVIPEFGQKEQLVEDYSVELGGSCSIFACQAAKLGLRVAGLGAVGNDFAGRFILGKLRNSGVITERIRVDGALKTGMGAALCKEGGDRSILTYPGSIDAACMEDMSDEVLASARHLHIGSYYLLNRLLPHFNRIAKTAKKYGATISLDTNWDPEETWDRGILELLPLVDVFMPNENEILAISRKNNIEDAVDFILERVPVIALKLGEKGAAVFTRKMKLRAEPLNVQVVDTVGAGDSFDAGFVYGMLSGLEMMECLRIGCICGSLNTRKAGGIEGQPLKKEVEDILQKEKERLL